MYKFLVALALVSSTQLASAVEIVKNLPVQDVQVVKKNGVTLISGILSNTTRKTLSTAMVTFALLDGEGIQVGSAIAAGMGIETGRKWKFEAYPGTSSTFATAKLVDVQAIAE